MKSGKQFSIGIKTYGAAFSFIFKNKLAWTFLIPIALTVLFLIGGQVLVSQFSDYIENLVTNSIGLDKDSFWGGFLSTTIDWILHILAFIIFAYISGYIVIMFMSPLLSYLSEKTEKILTGQEYKANLMQTIKDVVRGVLMSLRNLFIELILLFAMFLLSFIPIIGLVATIAVFFISAYFYGFSFMDFSNERHRLNLKESIKLIRKHKWLAIGNGTIYSLVLFIPFLGIFLSLFVAIISVVAATMALHQANAYNN